MTFVEFIRAYFSVLCFYAIAVAIFKHPSEKAKISNTAKNIAFFLIPIIFIIGLKLWSF